MNKYLNLPRAAIKTVEDYLAILAKSTLKTIVIKEESIGLVFFDLKSGFAEEILQLTIDHKKHLIVLGDYTDLSSKDLRYFIVESNKAGRIVFASTLEEAVKLLK